MAEKRAADRFNWSPGKLGKGCVINGAVHTWVTDPHGKPTYPFHGHSTFLIDPSGGVTGEGLSRALAADQRLYDASQEQEPTWEPKTAMALSPEHAEAWMNQNGPYMLHWTKPENVTGILHRGIMPGFAPATDEHGEDPDGYEDPYEYQPGDVRRNWEGFVQTRPGHTYLTVPGGPIETNTYSDARGENPYGVPVRVDLRKLDWRNLKADEDYAVDAWDRWKSEVPEEEQDWMYDPPTSGMWEQGTMTRGDWAEEMGLDDQNWTNESLGEGSVAHDGPIPPQAISLHPDYMDRYPQEALKFNPNQTALFDRTVAKRLVGGGTRASEAEAHAHADGAQITHRPVVARGVSPVDRLAADGDAGMLIGEDKVAHSRHSLADWDEPPADFFEDQQSRPWSKGQLGKGLISPDGQRLITWATNDYGEPHHDDVAGEQNFPYAAKVDVFPSGACAIMSPDEENLFGMDRQTAEDALRRLAPSQGLRMTDQFMAKTASDDALDLLSDWLSGFERPPVSLHHENDADIAPYAPVSPAEGHALLPPGHEPKTASDEPEDELHVALDIPAEIRKEIKAWVDKQDWPKGTELEDPEDYHITLLYSEKGHEEHQDADWIRHTDGYKVRVVGVDDSFGKDDTSKATVLRVDSDEVKAHADDLQDMAENHGLTINRFPGGYRAHLTVAYGPGKPAYVRTPKLRFTTGPSKVSIPRAQRQSKTADRAGDPLMTQPGDPSPSWGYLTGGDEPIRCPKCQHEHLPGPCIDSNLTQYEEMQRQWSNGKPNGDNEPIANPRAGKTAEYTDTPRGLNVCPNCERPTLYHLKGRMRCQTCGFVQQAFPVDGEYPHPGSLTRGVPQGEQIVWEYLDQGHPRKQGGEDQSGLVMAAYETYTAHMNDPAGQLALLRMRQPGYTEQEYEAALMFAFDMFVNAEDEGGLTHPERMLDTVPRAPAGAWGEPHFGGLPRCPKCKGTGKGPNTYHLLDIPTLNMSTGEETRGHWMDGGPSSCDMCLGKGVLVGRDQPNHPDTADYDAWGSFAQDWTHDPKKLPPLGTPKQGAMTRSQRLQQMQEHEAKFGPDQSEVQHTWPDGWSVRRLKTWLDAHREGSLMSHCLELSQGEAAMMRKYPNAPYEDSEQRFSIRDPDNLPHATFDFTPGGEFETSSGYKHTAEQPTIHSVFGQHNALPKQPYLARIHEWATNQTGQQPLWHGYLGQPWAQNYTECPGCQEPMLTPGGAEPYCADCDMYHGEFAEADQRLAGATTLYHVAPGHLRDEIAQNGLKVGDRTWMLNDSYESGLYAWDNLDDARRYAAQLRNAWGARQSPDGHDIWALNGVPAAQDSYSATGLRTMGFTGNAHRLHPTEVPADFLSHVERAYDPWKREAGMTLPQEQRAWQSVNPGTARTVHQFTDGSTVQHHPDVQSVNAVGNFMRNCWQGADPDDLVTGPYIEPRQPIPGAQFMGLHDANGIPRAAFYQHGDSVYEPLGMRNNHIHPQYASALADYATQRGLHFEGRDPDMWLDNHVDEYHDFPQDNPGFEPITAGMTLPQEQRAWAELHPLYAGNLDASTRQAKLTQNRPAYSYTENRVLNLTQGDIPESVRVAMRQLDDERPAALNRRTGAAGGPSSIEAGHGRNQDRPPSLAFAPQDSHGYAEANATKNNVTSTTTSIATQSQSGMPPSGSVPIPSSRSSVIPRILADWLEDSDGEQDADWHYEGQDHVNPGVVVPEVEQTPQHLAQAGKQAEREHETGKRQQGDEHAARLAAAQPLYHVAPQSARRSIQTNGIDHTKGERQWGYGYPAGNYLWTDYQSALRNADEDRHDLWQVAPTNTYPDPLASELEPHRVFTQEPIAPQSVSLIDPNEWTQHKYGDDDWEEHYSSAAPRKLYHISPAPDRESILTNGLLPRHPETNESLAEEMGNEPGVYGFDSPQAFEPSGPWTTNEYQDMWEIDTDGLDLDKDEATGMDGSWYSYDPIPAQRLRLHTPGRSVSSSARLSAYQAWKPGAFGRGFVTTPSHGSEVYTWPEEDGTHDEMARAMDADYSHSFMIRPNGEYFTHDVRYQGTPESHALIQSADPRLTQIPTPGNIESWWGRKLTRSSASSINSGYADLFRPSLVPGRTGFDQCPRCKALIGSHETLLTSGCPKCGFHYNRDARPGMPTEVYPQVTKPPTHPVTGEPVTSPLHVPAASPELMAMIPRQGRADASSIPSEQELAPYCHGEECYEWAQVVAQKYPQLEADSGFYLHPSGRPMDHAWTRAQDGTIVDTTHGQFDPSRPIGMHRPGTPEHGRYVSFTHHWPGVNAIAAQHRGMSLPQYLKYNAIEEDPQVVQAHAQQLWGQQHTAQRFTSSSASPKVMYHVAPNEAHDSLMAHGLDFSRRNRSSDWRESPDDFANYPLGNYLTSDVDQAHAYAYTSAGNVYQVDTSGLPLTPDPDPDWQGTGFYTRSPIAPDRLSMLPEYAQHRTAQPHSSALKPFYPSDMTPYPSTLGTQITSTPSSLQPHAQPDAKGTAPSPASPSSRACGSQPQRPMPHNGSYVNHFTVTLPDPASYDLSHFDATRIDWHSDHRPLTLTHTNHTKHRPALCVTCTSPLSVRRARGHSKCARCAGGASPKVGGSEKGGSVVSRGMGTLDMLYEANLPTGPLSDGTGYGGSMQAPADMQPLLDRYEQIGREVNQHPTNPQGSWDCHTGANMLTHLMSQAGYSADTVVGRYWHPDAASRNRTMGYEGLDGDDHRDELHYWSMVRHPEGHVLLDPNGEVRGEPRAQPVVWTDEGHYQGTRGTYEPFWDDERTGDTWDPLHKDSYPAEDLDPAQAAQWDNRLAEGIKRLGSVARRIPLTTGDCSQAGWALPALAPLPRARP